MRSIGGERDASAQGDASVPTLLYPTSAPTQPGIASLVCGGTYNRFLLDLHAQIGYTLAYIQRVERIEWDEGANMTQDAAKDFFVSYNKADREWAEWIAWQLETEGYTTVLQAWDFLPGSNFVLDMEKASQQASRTLALLSPDYLTSQFTPSEWA